MDNKQDIRRATSHERAEEIHRLSDALKRMNEQCMSFERDRNLRDEEINEMRNLLKEAYFRFQQYEMDVDDLPPRDHINFMNEIKAKIDA